MAIGIGAGPPVGNAMRGLLPLCSIATSSVWGKPSRLAQNPQVCYIQHAEQPDAPDLAAWAGGWPVQVRPNGAAVGGTERQDGAAEGDELPPLSRRTLHGDLVERLRDMIVEGQLAPGLRVNEGALGARLGVSRTPMREALKFLASEGLIELVPGRGALVRALTARDVQEMLEVLAVLEALAGRTACRAATDAEIVALRMVHDEMLACYAARDRMEYFKRNQAIHAGIVRISHNATLVAHHQMIQSRVRRIRFLGHAEPAEWANAVREHEEMMEALAARDGERLAEVLSLHAQHTWERVRRVVA